MCASLSLLCGETLLNFKSNDPDPDAVNLNLVATQHKSDQLFRRGAALAVRTCVVSHIRPVVREYGARGTALHIRPVVREYGARGTALHIRPAVRDCSPMTRKS